MDVARSSFKVFLAETVGVGLSFLAITYFARELGSAKLGTYFLFQALLFVLGRPADMGVGIAAEKRISENDDPAAVLSSAVVLKSVLLAVTLVGLFAARGHVNDFVGLDLAGLLGVALVLQELSTLMKNALSGELRVGETATIDFAFNLVKFGGGALLVYAGLGVPGLVYALIAGFVVRFVLAFRTQDTEFGRPSRAKMRSLTSYAKYTVIPGVGYQVHQWMDLLLIGFFLTNDAVGVYEVAWRVGAPVLLLSRSIGVAVFPQFSSWESAGSTDAIERMFSNVITPSLFLVFPSFFGTIVLSREILTIVFGQEFGAAWLVLIVVVAGKVPSAIRGIVGRCLYGLDEPKYNTVATSAAIVSNVVLNALLIWQFGIIGAAFGTLLSVVVAMSVRTYYLSKLIDIDVPYDELGWCFAASAGMAVILYATKTVVNIDSAVPLFGFVAAGAVLYFGFVMLYPPLKTQITTQIENVVPWPL